MCKLCEQLKKEKDNIEIYEVIVNHEECKIHHCPLCGKKITKR